jgi:glycerol-3-phosphate dehydrogenase
LIAERPSLAEPIPGTKTYLCVEAAYAASHEAALHIDDVLTRRTRISIETFDRGTRAAERVALELGRVLGWDSDQQAREVEHYLLRVEAERNSQEQPDDLSADATRLGAPDLRMGDREVEAKVIRLID